MISTESTAGQLFVDKDALLALENDEPLAYDSPRNLNILAGYTIPVLNYLRKNETDVVVGSDRSGRLFTTAVNSMWYELFDDEAFPTVDGAAHFAPLSLPPRERTDDYQAIAGRHLDKIITPNREVVAKTLGRKSLQLLIVDGIVNNGVTHKLVSEVLPEDDIHFAALWESKTREPFSADVYGADNNLPKIHAGNLATPRNVGISYSTTGELLETPTPESEDNYRRLDLAVKRVAQIIRVRE